MFEKYGFDGVFIAIQAVLTLYAQGLFKLFTCKLLNFFETEILTFFISII